MIVNSHDPLIAHSLIENQQEIALLSQFARGVVLDIGANVGSHAINFAKSADVVHAFEPLPTTFYMLCTNLFLNGVRNVVPYNLAIGPDDGTTVVANLDPSKPNTAMGIQTGIGSLQVPMRSIDSLAIHPMHFIKVDVEGFEYEVLQGACHSLVREDLIVFVEIHRESLVSCIIEFMTQLGYFSKELFAVWTPRSQFESYPDHYQYQDLTSLSKDAELVILTTSYLFWKPGRIQWS